MRTRAAILVIVLTTACGASVPTPVEPQYERSYHHPIRQPPAAFAAMDLPYFGGTIERTTDTYMQVSYRREATIDQLKEWWPAAVKAEGWVPTSEDMKPNGGFAGIYSFSDTGSATLTINPEGALWLVDLTVNPAAE